MPKVKTKRRLPNKIIPISNPDKKFHEKWVKGRSMLNIPHPARILAVGPPNVGKTTVAINIILRANPPYEEVYVIHPDAEYSQEWDDVNGQMMSEIPNPEQWEGEVKTFVVIDDIEVKQLAKEQSRALDRLFGYVSTHKNITVYLTSQNFSNIPAAVRRMSNFWVIWKINDCDAMKICAKKAGMKPNTLVEIFDNKMPEFNDSLWIDRTAFSPFPLRKNGFEPLKKCGMCKQYCTPKEFLDDEGYKLKFCFTCVLRSEQKCAL